MQLLHLNSAVHNYQTNMFNTNNDIKVNNINGVFWQELL